MLLLKLFISLLLVQFSFTSKEKPRICSQEQLDAWKQLELTDNDLKDGYHLRIKEKLISNSSAFLGESSHLFAKDYMVEYQCK